MKRLCTTHDRDSPEDGTPHSSENSRNRTSYSSSSSSSSNSNKRSFTSHRSVYNGKGKGRGKSRDWNINFPFTEEKHKVQTVCQKQIRETNLSMLISLGYTVGKIVTALGAETSSRGITLSSRDLDTIISSFRLNEVSLSEIDNLYGKSVFNSLDSVEKKSSNVLNSTSTNSCFECKHTASELERYRSECSKLRDGNRRYSIQNHQMNDEIRELRYRHSV